MTPVCLDLRLEIAVGGHQGRDVGLVDMGDVRRGLLRSLHGAGDHLAQVGQRLPAPPARRRPASRGWRAPERAATVAAAATAVLRPRPGPRRSTSSSVIRPPGPVPTTVVRSTPSLRAEFGCAALPAAASEAGLEPAQRPARQPALRRSRSSRPPQTLPARLPLAVPDHHEVVADVDRVPGSEMQLQPTPAFGDGSSTTALSVSTLREPDPRRSCRLLPPATRRPFPSWMPSRRRET